jgi:uncharacterized protein YcbK (DUF882 family)
MDIELIREQLNAVYSNYPWASEETAEKLATMATRNSIKSTALATAIMQLHGVAGADKLKSTIEETTRELKKSTNKTKAFIERSKKYTDRLGSVGGGMSGLDAITELTGAGAEALSAGANGLAGMTSAIPGLGTATKGFAWVTGGVAATAGVVAVFSKLITQQEKELRTMIDLGLVLSDAGNYTKLRETAANLGMGLGDYSAIMAGTSNVLTGTTGSITEGSGKLLDMLTNPEFADRIKKFGYTPKDLSMAMADELKQLYELNEINELSELDQRKVVRSFETGNKVGLFVANSLAGRKQELLDARKLIRDNANYKQAMLQNQEYYYNTFGEGAQENIKNFNDTFAMIAGPLLGEDLGNELIQVMADTANNIQYDHSPIQEMSSELVKKMKMLGPGVLEQFIELARAGQTNEIQSEGVAIAETAKLVSLIQQGPILEGYDQQIVEVGKVRAAALLVEPELLNMTAEQIVERMNELVDDVEGADDSIDIVGGMSKAFLKVQHKITPGFDTMGTAMKVFDDSLEGFADVWRRIFNLPGVPQDVSEIIDGNEIDPADLVSLLNSGNTVLLPGQDFTLAQRQRAVQQSYQREGEIQQSVQPLMAERNEIGLSIAELDIDGILRGIEKAERNLEAAQLDADETAQITATSTLNDLNEQLVDAQAQEVILRERQVEVENQLAQKRRLLQENREHWGAIISENEVTAEELDFTANPSGTARAINSMSPVVAERYLETVKSFEEQYGQQGYSILISEGYRTMARSDSLRASGVKAARGGHSYHNYGMAGDFLIYKDGELINYGAAYTDMLAEIAEQYGLHAPVSNDEGHFQPVEFPTAVPQELHQYKTQSEDVMTAAANNYLLNEIEEKVEDGIVVLENRIQEIRTEQETRSAMYPDGQNEALVVELAELEAQLAVEMNILRELEEERSNGG